MLCKKNVSYTYIYIYIYIYILYPKCVKKKVLLRDARDTQKKKPRFCDSPAKFYVIMLAEQEAPNIYSTKRGAMNIFMKDKAMMKD